MRQRWTIAADLLNDPDISPVPSYRVRRHPDAEWELVSDEIHGFQHEPGVETDLEVEITNVPAPAAGASNLRYDLVRILARRAR